ncbi:MAG: hypothetical protein IJ711_03645 [Lachnospiraceae bacterium]|nr:hypothetical protein [Lachnospiraceae bacterium]
MQDESIKLLWECNSGCKMAIKSMNQVREFVSNPELAKLIEKSKEKHQKLEEETSHKLADAHMEEKEPGVMASAFSWISTEIKMVMKECDNKIAKIMMDGCNMGIQSISEKMNEWKHADEESRLVANKLIDEEESFMKQLKAYL